MKQPRSFRDAISSLDLAWVPDEFYCKGVMGVLNFEAVVGGNRRKVQLIMTDLCPIRTILNFYSSKSPVLRQHKSNSLFFSMHYELHHVRKGILSIP